MKHFLLRGTVLLCASFLLFFSSNGCRRDLPESPALPDVRERFETALCHLTVPDEINFFDFDYLSSTNPNVVGAIVQRDDDTLTTALALRLLEMNQIHHFSGTLISRYGYPLWDRSEILLDSSSNHRAVILPIAKPDEMRTRAFIFAVPSVQGWGLWLYSAFQIDSLIQVVHTDSDNLAFKVAALLNNDVNIFRNNNLIYRAWLDSLSSVGGGQVGGQVQDRCDWTSFTICPSLTALTTISDRDEAIRPCYTMTICIGGSGFGSNTIEIPNDGSGGSFASTQTFATFWSACLNVMDSGIDPSLIDPAAVGGEMNVCQQLYAVHQNTLLLPYQLEYLKYRPTLLAAINILMETQGPTPSNQQMIASMFFYLEKGWMTDAQAEDVLRDIQNKVPMMKKLISLTTTLNLTQGQFQWLLQSPGAVSQFHQFVFSTNQNIPQADRNRLVQMLLGAYITDNQFLQRNASANFPNIGTETWAKTFRFAEPNAVEPEPNAQEIALLILHPVDGAIVFFNSRISLTEAQSRWAGTGSTLTHDNADAFRHAFWMAMNASVMSESVARAFGEAHESDTPAPLALAKTMDLFNNNQGIAFGVYIHNTGNTRTSAQIADDVDQLRKDGNFRKLVPLDFPNHPTTEGIIPGVTQLVPTTPN